MAIGSVGHIDAWTHVATRGTATKTVEARSLELEFLLASCLGLELYLRSWSGRAPNPNLHDIVSLRSFVMSAIDVLRRMD